MNPQQPSSSRRPAPRAGYTLIEMAVSLLGTAGLVLGLASSLFITLQASDQSTTSAAAILRGTETLVDLQADIQHARTLAEQLPQSITVTVADRQGDSLDDVIRYSWSGTPGDPLMRQYNVGLPRTVAEDVHAFSVAYESTLTPLAIQALTIELQISSDPMAVVESSFPLPNRP